METVASWERGASEPPVRHTAEVIRFLGYDPLPAEESLSGRVRAARRRLGLTQAEAAARLGLDEGTVWDLEHGRRRTTRRVRAAIERLIAKAAKA